jgi:VIT1/CCC1 family predicted Fe2+/Mn2+ transporter
LPRFQRHRERHAVERIGWLRAAVLGANDGIVSTASLIVGVASAGTDRHAVLVAAVAGLVAGAMSMAAGEYVSVSSQSDTEKADLNRERAEIDADPDAERDELTRIYVARGLDRALAEQVSAELMARDALGAHARDELGISDVMAARPIQAALTSALTFASGAAVPLLVVLLAPYRLLTPAVATAALLCLAALGATGAKTGGARVLTATVRVTFWGALALAVTAGIGAIFHVSA